MLRGDGGTLKLGDGKIVSLIYISAGHFFVAKCEQYVTKWGVSAGDFSTTK